MATAALLFEAAATGEARAPRGPGAYPGADGHRCHRCRGHGCPRRDCGGLPPPPRRAQAQPQEGSVSRSAGSHGRASETAFPCGRSPGPQRRRATRPPHGTDRPGAAAGPAPHRAGRKHRARGAALGGRREAGGTAPLAQRWSASAPCWPRPTAEGDSPPPPLPAAPPARRAQRPGARATPPRPPNTAGPSGRFWGPGATSTAAPAASAAAAPRLSRAPRALGPPLRGRARPRPSGRHSWGGAP